ncbi:MAG: hypothetical protein HRU34_05970 [Richelia sp.]|nr:hypothetical protein [Richelia sp.]
MPTLELGLGLWQGSYQDIERLWLRCYDADGNWILTPEEQIRQESQPAEEVEQKAKKLAAKLEELGINPEQL